MYQPSSSPSCQQSLLNQLTGFPPAAGREQHEQLDAEWRGQLDSQPAAASNRAGPAPGQVLPEEHRHELFGSREQQRHSHEQRQQQAGVARHQLLELVLGQQRKAVARFRPPLPGIRADGRCAVLSSPLLCCVRQAWCEHKVLAVWPSFESLSSTSAATRESC